MRIHEPLTGKLKPSSDNQSGIRDATHSPKKMRWPATTTKTTLSDPYPSTANVTGMKRVADIISADPSPVDKHPQQQSAESVTETRISVKAGNEKAMFGQRKNLHLMVPQEELVERHHRLTLDKLTADVPRPSLGGPLPLLHQSSSRDAHGDGAAASATGGAVAVVIVVCVGFLLVLIVVGIIKIRSTHRLMMASRHRRLQRAQSCVDESVLAWDDAGMKITVNPMEVLGEKAEPKERKNSYSDSSSDEDDDDSCRDGDGSDDEGGIEGLQYADRSELNIGDTNTATNGLQWDDSALGQSHEINIPRSRTYHV